MANYLNLHVPSSCHENWNQMAPEERGRFCLSCKKSVVDFTQMTDRELVKYFSTLQGSTCGRFRESQLNRDIPFPKQPQPWIKYFVGFSLPAILLAQKSAAQLYQDPTPVEAVPIAPKASFDDLPASDTVSLTGIVTDDVGVPLSNATIYIKGTRKGTLSDSQGRFILKGIDVPATVVISYVGYESKELEVDSGQQDTAIKLQLSAALMGEVVIAGFVAPKKIKRKERKESQKLQQLPTVSSIMLYPNPIALRSKLRVQCRSLERGRYRTELYTLSGQLVQVSTATYAKGDSQISLHVNPPHAGTYLLRLTHEKTGKQFSQQVVVHN